MESAEKVGKLEGQKSPLYWSPYQEIRANHVRGVLYQRAQMPKSPEMAKRLGFSKPLIQVNAGVLKADLRFADALIIETDPTKPAHVESISFKSRNLTGMDEKTLRSQFTTDAEDARRYYGGDLDIRTPALRKLGYGRVKVEKVYLIYDSENTLLGGYRVDAFKEATEKVTDDTGVEVRFQ